MPKQIGSSPRRRRASARPAPARCIGDVEEFPASSWSRAGGRFLHLARKTLGRRNQPLRNRSTKIWWSAAGPGAVGVEQSKPTSEAVNSPCLSRRSRQRSPPRWRSRPGRDVDSSSATECMRAVARPRSVHHAGQVGELVDVAPVQVRRVGGDLGDHLADAAQRV